MVKIPQTRKRQSGQAIVEAILVMMVGLAIIKVVSDILVSKGVAKNLTASPWASLDGMIQCGVWAPCGLKTPGPGHPSNQTRILSLKVK